MVTLNSKFQTEISVKAILNLTKEEVLTCYLNFGIFLSMLWDSCYKIEKQYCNLSAKRWIIESQEWMIVILVNLSLTKLMSLLSCKLNLGLPDYTLSTGLDTEIPRAPKEDPRGRLEYPVITK